MDYKIDTVIIDDDVLCTDCLLNSLKTKYSDIKVVGTAQTAKSGKSLILKGKPALVFLDIELPDMKGLDLLRELNSTINWPMQVVFYTAYDKYLLDALRESAFDYLLKPFDIEELDLVIQRFFNFQKKEKSPVCFSDELNRLTTRDSVFMVTAIDGYRMLHLNQVGYFLYQNDRKRWVVVLSDLTEMYLKRNTTACDILKYSNSFMQINRDRIINLTYLSMIKGKECILYPPFDKVKDLTANGGFVGALQERFSLM